MPLHPSDKTQDWTVADSVAEALRNEGVDTVFGICGGFLFHLYKAFERAGIRTIPSRHEGAAAHAAAAYTQATGRIGVVFGQGPGTSNTLTGVWAAYHDSTPLLVFAGQSAQATYCSDAHQEGSGSNHGVNQLAVLEHMTHATFRPPTSDSAMRSLRRALAIATTERGPVAIEIASNLLQSSVARSEVTPDEYRVVPQRVDSDAVERAADAIRDAQRPVVVLGHRLTHRGLAEPARTLVEAGNLPFATTDFAKGLVPEDHPLCIGVLGYSGHPGVRAFLEDSDLVITIGARLDSKTTFNFQPHLFPKIIQVDDVVADIGRNFKLNIGVLGDLPATLQALGAAVATRGIAADGQARAEANRQEYRTYREDLSSDYSDSHLSAPGALSLLRTWLPRNVRTVGDSGMNLHYFKRFFPVLEPDSFYCQYGWAAMGSGLPTAIGLQASLPEERVLLVCGDGGLLVHVGELQIAAEYDIPVIVFCINNAAYQQCEQYMSRWVDTTFGSLIQQISAAKIAEAFGCVGHTASTPAELESAVKSALDERRPTVIDVHVVGDSLDKLLDEGWDDVFSKIYTESFNK